VAVCAVAVAYAWFAAGAAPFHAWSYVAVGLPVILVVAGYARWGGLASDQRAREFYRRRSGGASWSSTWPWLSIVVAAVVLECIGLALGGRSPSVPTLSTTVDHLLACRWERWVLFVAWLLVGGVPVVRLRRQHLGRGQ
jgi:hypothetical protein